MKTITAPQFSVQQREFEGFWYIESNGNFFKGCTRCGGTGHHSYNGFDSICYKCNNSPEARLGDAFASEADAQKWCHTRALARAAKIRREERKALEAQRSAENTRAQVRRLFPEFAEFIESLEYNGYEGLHGKFLDSFVDKWHSVDVRIPTERQIAAVLKVRDDRAGKAAAKALVPALTAGRQSIVGTVVSTKSYETDYGMAFKMLVELDNGQRVYGSIPSSLLGYNVDKGTRVSFDAAVEPKTDDPSFGFYKRPTKAVIVEAE